MQFDPDIARSILQAVIVGMEPDRAAQAHGITPEQHAEWITQGLGPGDGDTAIDTLDGALAAEYVRALETAVAQAEFVALREVRSGGQNVDAWRWFLERRFPEQWAKTPAAARAAQMTTPAPTGGAADSDRADESRVDDIRRKREEKRRAAGGDQ